MQADYVTVDEKEASRCAEALLAGTYVDEDEEEEKGPAPMEDIKTAPEKPTKEGGKKGATNPKIEAFFGAIKRKREEAKELHGNGKYDDAMNKFKESLNILEKLRNGPHPDIPDSEFLAREMQLNTNIAVCYKQKQEAGGVVTYTTKVIDSPVDDFNLRLKAYLLRAYAYEEIDKMKLSKEDWLKVKEMQPGNIDASKALTRIQNALNKDKIQEKAEEVGLQMRKLDECKKKGNEFYKASKFIYFDI
jgi:tetratricopeptide (TPR) repeat protein